MTAPGLVPFADPANYLGRTVTVVHNRVVTRLRVNRADRDTNPTNHADDILLTGRTVDADGRVLSRFSDSAYASDITSDDPVWNTTSQPTTTQTKDHHA